MQCGGMLAYGRIREGRIRGIVRTCNVIVGHEKWRIIEPAGSVVARGHRPWPIFKLVAKL